MDDFDPRTLNEEDWFYSSNKLEISADHMLNSLSEAFGSDDDEKLVSFFNTYLLLLGYSLENFLKGSSIQIFKLNNPNIIINSFKDLKNRVWGARNGHELRNIFKSTGIEIFEPEETLLRKLEDYIIWRGKYPTPIKITASDSNQQSISKSDLDIIRQIKKRVNTEIEKKINNR